MTDDSSLRRIFSKVKPDEVYHLAGQSHVALSFDIPELTSHEIGNATLKLLEICRDQEMSPKIYLAGSSEIFERGYVTYSNAAKKDMLGIREKTLGDFGAVSEEIAREMAIGALERSGADISIAVTGIAGPGASEFKPEGRVCFARAKKSGNCQTFTKEFGPLGRENVRLKSCQFALEWLLNENRFQT